MHENHLSVAHLDQANVRTCSICVAAHGSSRLAPLMDGDVQKRYLTPIKENWYSIRSLQSRVSALDEELVPSIMKDATTRRESLGEQLLEKDVANVLHKEAIGKFLCQKHFMVFNGILIRIRLLRCAVCLRVCNQNNSER